MFRYANELTNLYGNGSGEPQFIDLMGRFNPQRDEELADLIEADGRLRIRLNLPVTIERYRSAIPDLTGRSILLDTAIDMSLRSLARTGHADENSIERLVKDYPDLEEFIRETAQLNSVVWSTQHVQRHVTRATVPQLPCSFGPISEDGQPRYELLELLGEGAFGQVFLAVDRQLSEEGHPALVSIKLLSGEERSGWARRQLIDEASKARRIDHPNVVRVLDRGISAHNQDFIVYEFVDGGDLTRRVRRLPGRQHVRQVVSLMAKIARGVHAAHMAGLVHCDLKPSNIILTHESEPKVSDFGIAIREEEQDQARHRVRSKIEPLGNLAYMAPEQYRMEDGALTIPADIYALGGILFWLLTGHLPNGDSPQAIAATHARERGRPAPPSARSHERAVDHDLDAICRRAMAIRPSDRHASAAALAEDLEAWLGREPIGWTDPSPWRRMRLWSRRKPGLAGATVLITLLLAGTGGTAYRMRALAIEKLLAQTKADQQEALAQTEKAKREQEQARAEREMQRAQAQEQINSNAQKALLLASETLRAGQQRAQQSDIWWPLLVIEAPYEPTVLTPGLNPFDHMPKRVELVRRRLEKEATDAAKNGLRSLMWQAMLNYWLVNSIESYGDPEVIRNIAELRGHFYRMLEADDPWLEQLEALELCARLHVIPTRLVSASVVPLALLDHITHEQIASRLEELLQNELQREPSSPFGALIADYLAIAYESSRLNDPKQQERWANEAEDLRNLVQETEDYRPDAEAFLWMMSITTSVARVLEAEKGATPELPMWGCERIDLTRSYVDASRAAGEGLYLRTLMWESYLCFGLLAVPKCAGEREAEERLKRLIGELEIRLAPDDPWLEHLQALAACARIRHLASLAVLDAAQREELASLASRLASTERRVYEQERNSLLERLMVEHLQLAHGPELLNDAQARSHYARRLAEVAR